jgi:Mn-dependent DtxR family transcriptional regulator
MGCAKKQGFFQLFAKNLQRQALNCKQSVFPLAFSAKVWYNSRITLSQKEFALMKLLESGQMYLETIYVLSREMPAVHSIDISEHMGYSKPSVSRAMGLLKSGGYITVDEGCHISLTEDGRAVAEKIYERHKILTEFLIKIGVSVETASDDACKIEHHISDESLNAIKRMLE